MSEEESHLEESSIGRTVDEAKKDLVESLRKIQAGQDPYDIGPSKATPAQERAVEPSEPRYQFQHLGDIVVQEVMPNDPYYSTAHTLMLDPIRDERDIDELKITDYPEEDVALARKEFEENEIARLAKKHWWLQPEWQEKLGNGELTEQIEFRFGDKVVNLFNFNEVMDANTLAVLKQTLAKIATINGGELLDNLDTIIFDNKADRNNTSEHETAKRGRLLASANARNSLVIVYTGGQELGSMKNNAAETPKNNPITGVDLRIPDVPKLAFVIAHELGHLNHLALEQARSEDFDNWHTVTGRSNKRLPESWQLLGSLDQSGVTRDYALTNEGEDFAESFALAILAPQLLDRKRQEYFSNLISQADPPHVEVTIRRGKDIQLPQVPNVVKYKIKPFEPTY